MSFQSAQSHAAAAKLVAEGKARVRSYAAMSTSSRNTVAPVGRGRGRQEVPVVPPPVSMPSALPKPIDPEALRNFPIPRCPPGGSAQQDRKRPREEPAAGTSGQGSKVRLLSRPLPPSGGADGASTSSWVVQPFHDRRSPDVPPEHPPVVQVIHRRRRSRSRSGGRRRSRSRSDGRRRHSGHRGEEARRGSRSGGVDSTRRVSPERLGRRRSPSCERPYTPRDEREEVSYLPFRLEEFSQKLLWSC